MKSNILISIVTPTLNNQKDLPYFINSIKRQIYPKKYIEMIISDGGSNDKTIEIAKKMGIKVISNPYILPDPGVNLGIKIAKGELIIVLAVDNIFRDKHAFKKLTDVFQDKSIIAAFPAQESSKSDSFYTKYINTFTDPFNHFVYSYSSNGRTFKKVYKTISSNKIYDVYDYSSCKDKPLIAVAQGFTIRKGFARERKSDFDDILPVIELINKRKKIAYVHSLKLYHHTVRDLKHFIKKQSWATVNALQKKKYGISHRMNYLSDKQKRRIKIWPLYSLTILPSFIDALIKLILDRDVRWIYHPFLCIISSYASLLAAIKFYINKSYEPKRQ